MDNMIIVRNNFINIISYKLRKIYKNINLFAEYKEDNNKYYDDVIFYINISGKNSTPDEMIEYATEIKEIAIFAKYINSLNLKAEWVSPNINTKEDYDLYVKKCRVEYIDMQKSLKKVENLETFKNWILEKLENYKL